MRGPRIVVESVSLAFGRKRVLHEVSLELPPGSVTGLIGPNGAGKTTLVGCLLGLLRPDSGRLSIDGLSPRDPRARRGLGHVPERPSLDFSSSGRAHLALQHALAGLPADGRDSELSAALEGVGLATAADEPPCRYSKGMLQRLSFAAAFLGEPRWLVLDEPFSGVDPAGVVLLRDLIIAARERAATIVINSHRLDQVGRLCDRVALIANGRVESLADWQPGQPGSEEELERRVLAATAPGASP